MEPLLSCLLVKALWEALFETLDDWGGVLDALSSLAFQAGVMREVNC